jgi:hypothetical protein
MRISPTIQSSSQRVSTCTFEATRRPKARAATLIEGKELTALRGELSALPAHSGAVTADVSATAA